MKASCWKIRALRAGLAAALSATLFLLPSAAARAVDWSGVESKLIELFYPGQSSWEWALTQADHSGAKKFRKGKDCVACHDGEQADMGALMAAGKKLEPAPVPGKRGSLGLKVQTAVSEGRLHVRLQWAPPETPAGGPAMNPDHEARVTMMIDDGMVKSMTRAGCWAACHDDLTGMASHTGDELTKYLPRSRTKLSRKGGGRNFKPPEALSGLREAGKYLEFWQAELNRDGPAVARDGYVLDARHVNGQSLVTAAGGFADGEWTVVLARELLPGSGVHKDLVPGRVYTLGFAVHEDHAARRFHHVSFNYSLALGGGDADFVAANR